MPVMKQNLVLLVLLAIVLGGSLYAGWGGEFGGADGQAEEVISAIDPGYEPWFEPFWEPPSGEIESLLFAVQAALGSAVIFFYMGYKYAVWKRNEAGS